MSEQEGLEVLYFKALEAEAQGDAARAFSLFMQGAALGDDAAQNAIGLAYDSGAGVKKDKGKAVAWFKKAWRTGKQTGYCLNIALTYVEIGKRRQAMHWWRKAVALGDGSAALSLAKFLMETNKPRDSKQILDLLKKAAESRESWQISPDQREEAQELLDSDSMR